MTRGRPAAASGQAIAIIERTRRSAAAGHARRTSMGVRPVSAPASIPASTPARRRHSARTAGPVEVGPATRAGTRRGPRSAATQPATGSAVAPARTRRGRLATPHPATPRVRRSAPSAPRVPVITAAPDATAQSSTVAAAHSDGTPAVRREIISPANTVFVSLCFEGPDAYSTAGGLGTRVSALTETLAGLGFETHLLFIGDPSRPGIEAAVGGRLLLKRWCQRISVHYPHGVYDGEEHKLYDYSESVPYHVCEQIARPAIEQGKIVIIIGEDWHTADAIIRTSDLLHWQGLRQRAILVWNCNSLKSLHRIDWGRLNYTATITTVSRYMKHKLWDYQVNPLVVPNGIPARLLDPVEETHVARLLDVLHRGEPERLILYKMGRFDPDKRWLMAIEAATTLTRSGHPIALLVRGGIEAHGAEVLGRAAALGLRVRDIEAQQPSVPAFLDLLRGAGEADIYNLRFFVSAEVARLCYAAADAVLANSGHEPFGLVGLEAMAARGIAFTGATGEEYARAFENAITLETDDPDEIVGYLLHLRLHPEEQRRIRAAGQRTAANFTWERVIEHLLGRLTFLTRKQGITLA